MNFFPKKNKLDFNKIMAEFITAFSNIIDTYTILNTAKGRLFEYFPIKNILFLINNKGEYISSNKKIHLSKNSKIVNWINVNSTHIDFKNFDIQYIENDLEEMDSPDINYIFPLETHNKLVGLALLKMDSTNTNQINFLKNIFHLTALSIVNAFNIENKTQKIKNKFENEKKSVVSGIASMMAHEIKNPLTSIRSTIQFIQESLKDSELKTISDDLICEVDRINRITESVLNYARPREIELEEINLYEMIKSLKNLFKKILEKEKIHFFLPDKFFNKMTIRADREALKQVLTNFMKNSLDALKDSKQKKIEINIIQNNDNFLFEWKDSGEGIPKTKINNIFEPFYTSKKNGNGLGLAISKKLMEEMNYHLNVKSKLSKGTCFYFYLNTISIGKKW